MSSKKKNKKVCIINGVVCSEIERIASLKAVQELSEIIIAIQGIPVLQETESQVWTLNVDKSSNIAKLFCQDGKNGDVIGFVPLNFDADFFPAPLANGIRLYLHDRVIRITL